MTKTESRPALVAVLAICLSQLAIALVIVPPWQHPDEPQHLQTVRRILTDGADFSLEKRDLVDERTIMASMARYRWWEFYGRETPTPLPASFEEGPARVVDGYFGPPDGGSRLYYRGVAALFRATGIRDVLPQLY